jgi:acyl-CoA synthetase (AMP-forming)/AMP-acid ligase II
MIDQPTRSLPHALRFWARATPAAVALRDGDDELTYGELEAAVESLAGRLLHAGVRPQDRVALVGENRAEWVLAFLACLWAGAVIVPMNVRLGAAELARQLAIAAPRLALVSGGYEELLARAAPALERRRLERDAGGAIWREPAVAAGFAPPAASSPGLVSFTSGTTGSPKGAVITHANLATSATIYARLLETTPDTTTLVLVPLFHNTGFLDQLAHMLVVGGGIDLLPEFHVADAVDALIRRPASYLIGVPSIFRLMMLDPRAEAVFGGVRILAYGGAPMPRAWIEELHARWPLLRPFNIYGLTEFTSLSHALGPAFAIARADTVGRPVEQVRQRIVIADGADAAPGEPGEVWLAGPMRMQGYLDDEPATAEVFRGPWLRTGDLGSVDDDGFLTLHGRIAEVIVRGGEKIHASQVESELAALPSVAEAAVVGVPDDVLQERVVACVVERPGHAFDADQARADLRDRIADYAVPDRFLVVDHLPRNANGKVDRALVRAAFTEVPR